MYTNVYNSIRMVWSRHCGSVRRILVFVVCDCVCMPEHAFAVVDTACAPNPHRKPHANPHTYGRCHRSSLLPSEWMLSPSSSSSHIKAVRTYAVVQFPGSRVRHQHVSHAMRTPPSPPPSPQTTAPIYMCYIHEHTQTDTNHTHITIWYT